MIVCAGGSENFKFATSIGIGLIDSAINLTKILSKYKADEIIFIGTAGLYQDGEILKIYESTKASNLEISALYDYSYTPLNYEIKSIVSRETSVVNSSNFITTDEKSAAIFAKRGYFMENMEFYSIIKVANFFRIPSYGIFVATNFCNLLAHQDFIKNHKEAKFILKNHLKYKGLI